LPAPSASGDGLGTGPSSAGTDLAALPPDARAVAALSGAMPLALPPHGTRLDRVQEHTTALVETAKEWAELRIKLVQTEVEEKVQAKVNQIIMRAIPLALIGLAGAFLLLTIALGLGWWLGHAFWGFLIVTLVLVLAAGVVAFINRKTLPNPLAGAEVDTETASHG